VTCVTCSRCGYNKEDRDYLEVYVSRDSSHEFTAREWICGLCFYAKVHGFTVEQVRKVAKEKRGPR
jgi:hypothetical protein